MKRVLRGVARALLGLLVLGVVALALYVYRAAPQQRGAHVLPGLSAAVIVERDEHGVPTLQARSLADLAQALGFVHAQDRGWQLEAQRRVGRGELAEAFGAAALDTDRFLRALGVHRNAEARWARLQAAARAGDASAARSVAVLRAYSAGVNAGWAQQARPPEMLVLGLPRQPWTPSDSLAWASMMSWDLATIWQSELLRLRLALQGPADDPRPWRERHDALLPPYSGQPAVALPDLSALYRGLGLGAPAAQQLAGLLEQAPPSGVEGVGSNNWLVTGARSSTGAPLVANDPHLKMQTPSLWYLARLQAPELRVAGGTLPGLPFVVLGQSEGTAWAFTNTGPDTQDLYLEALREREGRTEVRTPEGWAEAETREERIRVKGAADVLLRVRSTRHGPLISDAGPGQDLLAGDGRRWGLALRWAALDLDHDPIDAGLRLSMAGDVPAFLEATRVFAAPMQNMLVADRQGRTAFIAAGRVPVRSSAHDLFGLAPAPGWEARYDWQGWLPHEALPSERDPARGWLASANQRVVPPDYAPHLSVEWAAPWRQQRIEQLLQARPKHDLASLGAMQQDQHSLAAAPLLPWLRRARSAHALAAAAQQTLQGFEGEMRADAAAPLIYWAWQRQLTIALFRSELGEPLFDKVFPARSLRDALDARLSSASGCDDRRTPVVERCDELAGLALTRALDELQARHGAEVARWRWGDAHRLRAEHRPFSRVAALRPLFELSAPVGGDTHSINVSRVMLRPDWTGALYTNDHGAGLRTLLDAADPRRSRMVQSTGQSGLPWRSTYRDQFALWREGSTLPLWADAPPTDRLTLQPAP